MKAAAAAAGRVVGNLVELTKQIFLWHEKRDLQIDYTRL